jgi:hypothetical protein
MLSGVAGTVGGAYVADRLARHEVRRRLLLCVATAVATAVLLGAGFAVVPPPSPNQERRAPTPLRGDQAAHDPTEDDA